MNTFVVALTGGIGSGKSAVSEFFAELGVPIIDADPIARSLVAPSTPAFKKIIKRFGKVILKENGELNRTSLRNIIFNHPEDKKWLEGLLHPLIRKAIVEKIAKVTYPYCIVVIPLLTEHYDHYRTFIDHVIVMEVSKAQQLRLAAARDQTSAPHIQKIIDTQADPQARLKIADTLLRNEGTLLELKNQVITLHHYFLNL